MTNTEQECKRYSVFRKSFHIPKAWADKEDVTFLVNHSYTTSQADQALEDIARRLKNLGYMRSESDNRMIHDYLCYFLQDLLDKNGDVYLTEEEIRSSKPIRCFFEGLTPDLLIKTKPGRDKPLIVDVYTGGRDAGNTKAKYKAFGSVADLMTVHPNSLLTDLTGILPVDDVAYMHRHFQVFMTEYQYWKSCVSLNMILKSDIPCLPITSPVSRNSELTAQFALGMKEYAEFVLNRSNI